MACVLLYRRARRGVRVMTEQWQRSWFHLMEERGPDRMRRARGGEDKCVWMRKRVASDGGLE